MFAGHGRNTVEKGQGQGDITKASRSTHSVKRSDVSGKPFEWLLGEML